jgi:hypothetical protein
MVIGASWAGARAFTPTSGPGISLMNEFIGLAYYAEIPAVIFDVQRTGPSTGMPTRTQQGDLMLCAYASHGDTKHICLYPADPKEASTSPSKSFDLAERFQTPVFVLTDLDIGMNDWMVPKLTWDDAYQPDRGKVLSRRGARKLPKFYRYSTRTATASRRARCPARTPRARTSRAARATTSSAYTEDAGRVPGGDRPPRTARSARPQGRAGADHRRRWRARTWASSPSAAATRACMRGARPARAERASTSTTCACAASRSATRWSSSSRTTRLRGRAEPRRAAAEPADARDRREGHEARLGALLRRASR